jgi:hypothetical protein
MVVICDLVKEQGSRHLKNNLKFVTSHFIWLPKVFIMSV